MLNYIWAGLIFLSLLFAVGYDVSDLAHDKYRNGQALPVHLAFPQGYDPAQRTIPVVITLDPAQYASFYHTDAKPAASYTGSLRMTKVGARLRFDTDATLPDPLTTISTVSQSQQKELQGAIVGFKSIQPAHDTVPPTASAGVVFEPVRFVKLNAISGAALDFAKTAAEISLGLIGVLTLFLGILKIAEHSGVIYSLVKLVQPVLRPLFPEIPEGNPALGMIALNITANMFGLGNAATPFGIKAMEELQKLNPSEDTATNSMVMLLAINTASVQLMPPVLLLAILGLQMNALILPIIVTGVLGLVIAITSAKLYGRLPSMRASDPMRLKKAED